MKLSFLFAISSCLVGATAFPAEDSTIAANAINTLGVDLYHLQARSEGNLLFSPYAIQGALAMTYAGADGDTRAEMQRTLHFPEDQASLDESFSALAQALAATVKDSVERAQRDRGIGDPVSPIEFRQANRLFAQRGYEFLPPFLGLLKERYGAPLEEMDFQKEPEKARAEINRWVLGQTSNRIRDLVPAGGLRAQTRLLLVNALYLRAPWTGRVTINERFLAHGREGIVVPTMLSHSKGGYAKGNGFQIVVCHYSDQDLQLVMMVPDNPGNLAGVERLLTPKMLEGCAHLPERNITLHLPKFHLEPPTLPLSESLKALGLKTAFDDPAGTANFARMAPRKPDDYLFLDAVWHKASIAIDEKGAEAAVSVGIEGSALSAPTTPVPVVIPVEVRVDRPFLFAIQHLPSGVCLFLGRVTDPR